LKHNPAGLVKKVAVGLVITAGIVLLCTRRSRKG